MKPAYKFIIIPLTLSITNTGIGIYMLYRNNYNKI